jgi:nitroreductase
MELFEAIHGRVSVGRVKPDPLPRDVIEKLLDAAVQAPNHHKVRPWRFVALTGDARKRLGDVFAASFADHHPDLPPEALDKPRATPLAAPLVIAVGVDKPSEPKVIELENICASAAAAQNLLLAAHALGLGAKWRTGEWVNEPKVKEFLGFAPDQTVIAFLYVGYPETPPQPRERPGFDDRVTWME